MEKRRVPPRAVLPGSPSAMPPPYRSVFVVPFRLKGDGKRKARERKKEKEKGKENRKKKTKKRMKGEIINCILPRQNHVERLINNAQRFLFVPITSPPSLQSLPPLQKRGAEDDTIR